MSEIKPALTAEEWNGPLDLGLCGALPWGRDGEYITFDADISREDRLRLAVRWLHEAGIFAWDDVDLLRNEVSMLIGDVDQEEDARWRSLADRIAALLPPRKG